MPLNHDAVRHNDASHHLLFILIEYHCFNVTFAFLTEFDVSSVRNALAYQMAGL